MSSETLSDKMTPSGRVDKVRLTERASPIHFQASLSSPAYVIQN